MFTAEEHKEIQFLQAAVQAMRLQLPWLWGLASIPLPIRSRGLGEPPLFLREPKKHRPGTPLAQRSLPADHHLDPVPDRAGGPVPGFAAPLALLSVAMMLTSLAFTLVRLYVTFHSELLGNHIGDRQAGPAMFQSGIAPVFYALAVALAFVWPPGAIIIQVLVLIAFFVRSPVQHMPIAEEAAQ